MRKTFCLFLALSVCSTFSFYKMLDVVLFESKPESDNYIKVPNNQALNSILHYRGYAYNQQLKYGFKLTYDGMWVNLERFKLFQQRSFDRAWWENYFSSYEFIHMPFYIFDVNFYKTNSFELLKNKIQLDRSTDLILFGFTYPFLGQSIFKSQFGIHAHNSKQEVKLSNSKGNTINFEKAFKSYVRKQKSLYDDNLFQHVIQFIHDKNAIVNDTDPIKTSSVSKILNISKITYTEDQLELLENSEILAIWALPSKIYSDKDYIKWLNEQHKDHKDPGSKDINRIIIGFAVDKRDNTTFHWVTDLGQDISVLFDYADELKESNQSSK